MSDSPYKVLAFGPDSLWVNVVYGSGDDLETMQPSPRPLDGELFERLTSYKEQALALEKPVQTPYEFDGAWLMMYGNGGGLKTPWRFILRNHALEVKVGLGKRNGIIAKVRLSAEYLWKERDLESCLCEVYVFLVHFFEAPIYLQLSEVHLCADITGYDFGKGDWQEGFIRRSGLHPHFKPEQANGESKSEEEPAYLPGPDDLHMRHRPITGFSFGTHKSAVSAVVYNKTTYIKQKARETAWFYDIWQVDESTEVWRVEFHLKRDALHAMSLESASDLLTRMNALWEYCSIEWLRYAVPGSDTNRSRWEVHPVWAIVQRAFFVTLDYEQVELGPVVRERKREVNIRRMVAQLVGCLITLHAWRKDKELCEGDDLSIVLHHFFPNGEDYLEEKGKVFDLEVQYKQRLYSLVAA